MEQGNLRQYTTSQKYQFFEIDKDTTIDHITLGERFSYGDLYIVPETDLEWQNCQDAGFGGYGIFQVQVCVKEGYSWKNEFVFREAHVLIVGGSIQSIQHKALTWFENNRDLVNSKYPHRYGREITPMLVTLRCFDPYVPKEK
ncbi:hypothetical protein MZD04_gp361 [Pseudomonas phage Psa21]|uniref:Uncharacterized protein n=1 Tax=Pseudomonas phage Psa21 TaxID=2530023 RepID=A0A481W6P2_9CAUD|nr:hypothetical protein MZD04_gp361 [Pseudomonas phage Psa21]QBJ02887.1 hypothetical protein PSA21_361 [Pseudomonas phage Psa21]